MYTLYNIHYTIYIVQHTLYNIHCTSCTDIIYTLYSSGPGFEAFTLCSWVYKAEDKTYSSLFSMTNYQAQDSNYLFLNEEPGGISLHLFNSPIVYFNA